MEEQAYRLRTLLSVDDVVKDLREYLIEAGEWDRTYWIFTSGKYSFIYLHDNGRFAQPRCGSYSPG